jgi:BolA protein
MHNVPPNSETHFKLVLVSDNFLGLSKVQRHQMIYKILLETMKQIHALSIQAFTIEEYNKNPLILESPDCSNNK